MGVRTDLVDFLEAAHPEYQWYTSPPGTLKPPAVVVNPGDPYIIPFTSGGPGLVTWGLDLVFVVLRAKPEYGLTQLEEMFTAIGATLTEYPSARFLDFTVTGTTEIGGVDHLTGELTLAVQSEFQ